MSTSPSSSSSSGSVSGSDITTLSSPTTSTTSSTPSKHQRSDSDGVPWIIHHILENEFSNELPLRVMFSFNTGQKIPRLKDIHNFWQYDEGKLINEFLSSLDKILPSIDDTSSDLIRKPSTGPPEKSFKPGSCPLDRFVDAGNEEIFNELISDDGPPDRRANQSGLPPSMILKLCERIFPIEYKEVNFKQGLTGLDYLRDLELTRRLELHNTANRLGIRKENWKTVLANNPDAYAWVEMIQNYELRIEEHYAAIFVDLRIWTMLAELKSLPFYKPNILAMLNTLFPPNVTDVPNDRILPKVLNEYRCTFYRYVVAVEASGPGILSGFEAKLQMSANRHNWTETRKHLEDYMDLADLMITQAKAVYGGGFFREKYLVTAGIDAPSLPISTEAAPTAEVEVEVGPKSVFEEDLSPTRTTRLLKSGFGSLKSRASKRNLKDSQPLSEESALPPIPPIPATSADSKVKESLLRTTLPKIDTSTPSTPRKSHRWPISKPVIPFFAKNSEASQHGSFRSPIVLSNPRDVLLENKTILSEDRPVSASGVGPAYRTVLKRPSTSSGAEASNKVFSLRPSTASGDGKSFTTTLERLRNSSFYNQHINSPSMPRPLNLPKSQSPTSGKLPSDGGRFLEKPYEPESSSPQVDPSLKRKFSFGKLRMKKSSTTLNEVPEEQSTPTDSPSQTANDDPDVQIPALKKQSSFGMTLKSLKSTKPTEKISKVVENADDTKRRSLKKRKSIGEGLKTSKQSKPPKSPKIPQPLKSPSSPKSLRHFKAWPDLPPGPGASWEPVKLKVEEEDMSKDTEESRKFLEKLTSKRKTTAAKSKKDDKSNLTVKREKEDEKDPKRVEDVTSDFPEARYVGESYERWILSKKNDEGISDLEPSDSEDEGDLVSEPQREDSVVSRSPKKLRRVKSVPDLDASGKHPSSETDSDATITPSSARKSTWRLPLLHRHASSRDLKSKDISEPMPVPLPFNPKRMHAYEVEEMEETFRSKEYSREWQLQAARAEKNDLDRPKGKAVNARPRRLIGKSIPYVPLETPRATPKPPEKPIRWREDTIFPHTLLLEKAKPKQKHQEIDMDKYQKKFRDGP